MTNVLYPHQRTGAVWLAERTRAALFDEMGLGKTITAIEAMNRVRSGETLTLEDWPEWRVLVIAPAVVLHNWKREWGRWSDMSDNVQIVKKLGDDLDASAQVVIMSHRAVSEPEIHAQITAVTWDLCIVDEAHAFRNRTSLRTVALYGSYGKVSLPAIVDVCERVWLLTGTPIPNDVRDLWTMCWGLWREHFMSRTETMRLGYQNRVAAPMAFDEFERRYSVTRPAQWGRKRKFLRNLNADELRIRTGYNTLTRTKADHLNLPPLRRESIVVRPDKLGSLLETLNDELSPSMRVKLRNSADPVAVLKLLNKHTQLSTLRRLIGIAKVEPVAELLHMEQHDKIVVFAIHTAVLSGLAECLGPDRCVLLDGSVPPLERQMAVDQFQGNPRVRYALCQIVAGGVGITLTAASEVMFVELSWVPGENDQAGERVHRIGQDKPCRIRDVALAGTIDEAVVKVLGNKAKQIQEIL